MTSQPGEQTNISKPNIYPISNVVKAARQWNLIN